MTLTKPAGSGPSATSVVAVVVALLGASSAAIAMVSQDVEDTLVAAGGLVSVVALLYVWHAGGRVFAAQALALIQGALWLILLSHGGWGIILGPVAWVAAGLAGRLPAAAAILLAGPIVLLLLSWWPILAQGPSVIEVLILTVLVTPASIGAALLLLPSLRRAGQPTRPRP